MTSTLPALCSFERHPAFLQEHALLSYLSKLLDSGSELRSTSHTHVVVSGQFTMRIGIKHNVKSTAKKTATGSMTELQQGFYIGPWLVEPKLNRFSRQNNDDTIEHITTPKVMALCALLAENQGEPVSQQEITERVWSGLVISDSSIYQAIAQLRKVLHDNQPQKQFIERVSGKGYRLIKTVSPLPKTTVLPVSGSTQHKLANIPYLWIGIIFTLIVLISIWTLSIYHSPGDSLTKATDSFSFSSMAIHPTQNFTQPRQEQLNTFSHLILSDLLSIPDMNLILIRDEQQASNADVELTHSLSNKNDELLLSARLTQRSDRRVIWAAEFNSSNNRLLDLKHQLTTALTSVLMSGRSKQPLVLTPGANLNKSSYESFVLAQYLWNKRKPNDLKTAHQLYQNILQEYPDNIETLVGLCNTYLFLHTYSDWTEEKAYSACAPLIERASQLSPQNGKVLATKALLSSISDSETITNLFETSIAQAPNYANAYLWYGNFLRRIGKVEKALAMHQKALSLDPLSPNINRSLAYSLLNQRQLHEARKYYQRALTIEPQYSLRPVEELDFLPLDIERAKQFITWSKNDSSNLSQRSPYLLTQALVRLGLGQTAEAEALVEKADVSQVNESFWLYTQAAMSAAKGAINQARRLLKERYLSGLAQQENTNRHVMPYLVLLVHSQQYAEAHRLFSIHFPEIDINATMSDKNIRQFIFLYTLMLSTELTKETKTLALKIANYFNHVEQPQLTLPYIQWLIQSMQNEEAKSAIEALFAKGWLPDFNDNILSEVNLRKAYIDVGGEQHQFDALLTANQRDSLNE